MFEKFAHAFLGLTVGATLVVGLVLLLIFMFEIVMFVDAILNKNISDERKVLWLVGMVLLHPIVAIAYYFTDHKVR